MSINDTAATAEHIIQHPSVSNDKGLFLRRKDPAGRNNDKEPLTLYYSKLNSVPANTVCMYHLAKLMASSGSWASSSSRCLSAMDCIFIRFSLVVCCSVRMCGVESSPCWRRNCIDSRKRVYKLFLSASEIQTNRMDFVLKSSLGMSQGWRDERAVLPLLLQRVSLVPSDHIRMLTKPC